MKSPDERASIAVQEHYMRRIVELDELVFALMMVGSTYQVEQARAHRALVWEAWQDECRLLTEAEMAGR